MGQMSLGQAIRNAIVVEEAAEQFYRTLADSTDDIDAKRFLIEMADQERSHKVRITDLSSQLETVDIPFRPDDNVELIETSPDWADVDNIDFQAALSVALENEQHAAQYYCALSDATDGKVSTFFRTLMKDEEMHVARLTERLEG